jgi:hypothetical protein
VEGKMNKLLVLLGVLFLSIFFVSGQGFEKCDVNKDQIINIIDLTSVTNNIGTSELVYDTNGDARVNQSDYNFCKPYLGVVLNATKNTSMGGCVDTDNGLNPYVKGMVYEINSNRTDMCQIKFYNTNRRFWDRRFVPECGPSTNNNFFDGKQGSKAESCVVSEATCPGSWGNTKEIYCKNGCKDGACTSLLTLSSQPFGADVYFDGVLKGKTPIKITGIIPGQHDITIVREGYVTYYTRQYVDLDQALTLSIILNKKPTLSVFTSPNGASVYLNEEYKGNTPVKLILNSFGYNIRINKTGYYDFNSDLALYDDQDISWNIELMKYRDSSMSLNSIPAGVDVYLNDFSSKPNKTDIRGNLLFSNLLPGLNVLKIAKDGYRDYISNLFLNPHGVYKLGVSLSQKTNVFNCFDTDPSIDQKFKGTVYWTNLYGNNFTYEDSCEVDEKGKSRLKESYCLLNEPSEFRTYCEYGCMNGACLAEPINCKDSEEGKDYFVKGTVTYSNSGSNTDICILKNTDGSWGDTSYEAPYLVEYSCPSSSDIGKEIYLCPSGCKDGACIKSISFFRNSYWACYDGVESYEGGPTSCKSSETWLSYGNDFCKGHCSNVSGKCGLNSFKVWNECSENVTCTDSDGGYDYNVKGFVTGDLSPFGNGYEGRQGTVYDFCVQLSEDGVYPWVNETSNNNTWNRHEVYSCEKNCAIYEMACNGNIIWTVVPKCPYGCKDGACLEFTSTAKDYLKLEKPSNKFNNGDTISSVWPETIGGKDLSFLVNGIFSDNKGESKQTVNYAQELLFSSSKAGIKYLQPEDEEAGYYFEVPKNTQIYKYTLKFNTPVMYLPQSIKEDFQGDVLKIYGKDHVISAVSSDSTGTLTKMKLLSGDVVIWLIQDQPFTVGDHTLTVIDVDSNATMCGINVDGTTVWVDKYTTEEIAGLFVAVLDVKAVNSPPKYDQDTCKLLIGANEMVLEKGDNVVINGEEIKGSGVNFLGTLGKWQGIEITYDQGREDEGINADSVYLKQMDSWVDPVFGEWKLLFDRLNGDTNKLTVEATGEDAVLKFSNNNKLVEIPLYYNRAQNGVRFGTDDDEPLLLPFGSAYNISVEGTKLLYVAKDSSVHVLEIEDLTCANQSKITIKDLTYGTIIAKDQVLYRGCNGLSENISLGSLGRVGLVISSTSVGYNGNSGGYGKIIADNSLEISLFNIVSLSGIIFDELNSAETKKTKFNVSLTYDPAKGGISISKPVLNQTSWYPETEGDDDILTTTTSKGTILKYDNENKNFLSVYHSKEEVSADVYLATLAWIPSYKFGLQDYPRPFVVGNNLLDLDVKIVVGETASTSDAMAAVDLASSLGRLTNKNTSSIVILDRDVINNLRQGVPLGYNLISIGPRCANTVSAYFLGSPNDCNLGFEQGKAKLKLFQTNGKTVLLASGISDVDTRGAATLLANYQNYSLWGDECEVVVMSSGQLIPNCV